MIVPKKTKINNQTTIDCDFHGKTGRTALLIKFANVLYCW
jgi:hypothetical protein